MRSDRILDWLDSVVPANDRFERPRKRTRLNDGRASNGPIHSEHLERIYTRDDDHIPRLPTPLASSSGSIHLPRHSSMPPKRPWSQADGNDFAPSEQGDQGQGDLSGVALLQVDVTPRPPRRSATAAALDGDVGCLTPSLPSTSRPSSSLASSRASKISRNSSPTKQLRNAELDETGFLRTSLRDDKKPKLLQALTEELRRIEGGFGILPSNLQSDVRAVLPLLLCLLALVHAHMFTAS